MITNKIMYIKRKNFIIILDLLLKQLYMIINLLLFDYLYNYMKKLL